MAPGYIVEANCSKSLLSLKSLMAELHIQNDVDISWHAASGPLSSLFWHGFPLPTLPASQNELIVPPLEILSTGSWLFSLLCKPFLLFQVSAQESSLPANFLSALWQALSMSMVYFFLRLQRSRYFSQSSFLWSKISPFPLWSSHLLWVAVILNSFPYRKSPSWERRNLPLKLSLYTRDL